MAGIEDPGVIDLITRAPDGAVALIISHDRPWTDSDDEVDLLVEKINNYAAYALDEGLVSTYPESANRPKRIQVDCLSDPTPKIADVLAKSDAALAEYSIRLTVNRLT